MQNFLSFQKVKGLYVAEAAVKADNGHLVNQINHELVKLGYFCSQELANRLSEQSNIYLNSLYADLITEGIGSVIGGDTHQCIYKNFPQSVLEDSYTKNILPALVGFQNSGTWSSAYTSFSEREFKIEPINYKEISLITKNQFDNIFTNLLYSGNSISPFDKKIIDWFIANGYTFDFSKITFKETLSYVGKQLLNEKTLTSLPTKDATNVLRIYSVYSGGDEGLKVSTKFVNLKGFQKLMLLNTLESSFNLEESFKVYREKWLRVLFYLNPMVLKNKAKYPEVFRHTDLLRNTPKELRTFNSRVEELIGKNDKSVLDLLKTRKGIFMRRLDHMVRLFGINAIDKYLQTSPDLMGLVTIYNQFSDRDKEQTGRGAVLASQYQSNVVTYDALKPLETALVNQIKSKVLSKINILKSKALAGKKVYIDRSLYYRSLSVNNRASSLSLDGTANGSVEKVTSDNTIRMYVNWAGQSDIDLSALVIYDNNEVTKVGWNSTYNLSSCILYSGDNIGRYDFNSEYIDINLGELPDDVEWIITEARIYSGPNSFEGYNGEVRAGWMLRDYPEANDQWLPDTIEHSLVLNNKANTAYLMAFHVPSKNIVSLDLAMGTSSVSNSEDAIKMRMYLESFVSLDKGETEVQWDKINQGHILNLLSDNIVDDKSQADLIFESDKTNWEDIASYI